MSFSLSHSHQDNLLRLGTEKRRLLGSTTCSAERNVDLLLKDLGVERSNPHKASFFVEHTNRGETVLGRVSDSKEGFWIGVKSSAIEESCLEHVLTHELFHIISQPGGASGESLGFKLNGTLHWFEEAATESLASLAIAYKSNLQLGNNPSTVYENIESVEDHCLAYAPYVRQLLNLAEQVEQQDRKEFWKGLAEAKAFYDPQLTLYELHSRRIEMFVDSFNRLSGSSIDKGALADLSA